MSNKRMIAKKLLFIMLAFFMALSNGGGALLETSYVCAAKKSGSTNMTKSIKVKSAKGRNMTADEVAALSGSTFKLFDNIMKSEPADKNVLISPSSIYYAFGMAENGAKSSTKSQLENVVNGGIKSGEFNKILAASKKRMMTDKCVKWNVANSVWYIDRKDVKVKKKFLKKVKSYYGAEVYKAPFNSKTLKDVNSWVKKNTHKMIPKVLDRISKDEVMYIINAMAFEGEWGEQFKDSQVAKNQEFTNIDGSKSKTTMLSEKEESYFELNGGLGFRKKYKGYNYSFVGIMMPDNMTPSEYISKLSENGGEFPKQLSNVKSADVYVKFPEFSYDYDIEMSKVLKNMGVSDAFDQEKANLNNMFKKTDDYNYCFSKVIHKTHIEVDKNGTKAAAVTAIYVDKATAFLREREKVYITLDKPFVYAIVDDKTNLPVFVGVVNKLN